MINKYHSEIILITLVIGLGGLGCKESSDANRQQDKPNIIYILTDELSPQEVLDRTLALLE